MTPVELPLWFIAGLVLALDLDIDRGSGTAARTSLCQMVQGQTETVARQLDQLTDRTVLAMLREARRHWAGEL